MRRLPASICHDGQGSATAFEWVSAHAELTLRWKRHSKYGWFDNPHWIYLMYAKRSPKRRALRHHDVVELEPSEKFADAPAAKVTHGYHLIRKYGCYGCHEINGFDGPTRRVGPDLRSEPNYFAVAQQIEAELATAKGQNGEAATSWKELLGSLPRQVTDHPEDNDTRLKLKAAIDERVAATGKDGTLLDKSLSYLSNMLKM